MATVILFRGKAGTGKTTLSKELGRRLRLPVLHKDDIYDAAAGFVSEHQLRNRLCFDFLYRFLQTVMDARTAVILDFGFNQMDDARRLKSWIEERGGNLQSFLCVCSDESVWAERLAERSVNPQPNQLITDLSELKEHYKDAGTECLDGEIVLDTVLDKASLADRVESKVSRWGECDLQRIYRRHDF
ncbi:ATP-binding protein [Paenibacillus sp. P26]|nr:ATP-binding protein [Paenibacillus sp. P26]UUZ89678.1 ATP-binding protein [Paenibacillus sp. P25]